MAAYGGKQRDVFMCCTLLYAPTLRSANALQTYVCKYTSPIGWWTHQADNRGR